jgi:hypothetical protein
MRSRGKGPGRIARVGIGVATAAELVVGLAGGKRFWLAPMAVVLLLAAVLLGVVHAVEYVAPFVYTVF